jgi:hypothetical protein
MNAIQTANTLAPITMGFNNLQSFEFMQRTAAMFSDSTMVPAAYQATVVKGYGKAATTEHNPAATANCMIALDMSQRMNANPLMIMQNLHIIEGRPSWSSQFIIAAINNCGKFSPLRFDLEWLEDIDATFSTFEWVEGRKTEQKKTVRIRNARCVAWAVERETGQRLESAPVSMEMAVNEGWYGKNGSKWKSMPDLMMRYRSAAFFGRIYAPELLMGLPSAEETSDVFSVSPTGEVGDVERRPVPKSSGQIDPVTGEVTPPAGDRPELPAYTDESLTANLPKWRVIVQDGKRTPADIVAMVSTKATLTAEQIAQIHGLAVTDVTPVQADATPTPKADTPSDPGSDDDGWGAFIASK